MTILSTLLPTELKQTIRALLFLPRRLNELLSNYFYDMQRFLKHSSVLQFFDSKQQLLSWIDADLHKIEKALALSEPKPGFGQGVAERLVRQILLYENKYGDNPSIQTSIDVLRIYKKFNLEHEVIYTKLFEDIEHLSHLHKKAHVNGGYDELSKQSWLDAARQDLVPFFKSRRSVRNFSDQEIDFTLIEKAVEMAMYTPTVCNRQAVKVHAFTAKESRERVLSCQMGNAGFGHQAKSALVITVDRECFFTAGERNQCWIDGGLFSMSLVYALHSLGLGTCCLNWSVTKERDKVLRSVIDIKDSEAVIMMIAVGHLKEHFKVAKSARKSIEHFLSYEKLK